MTMMFKCDFCGNVNLPLETIGEITHYNWSDAIRDMSLRITPYWGDDSKHLCTGCMAESLRDMLNVMFPRPKDLSDNDANTESSAGADSDMPEVRASEPVQMSSSDERTLVSTRCRCEWGDIPEQQGRQGIIRYSSKCPVHGFG